MNYYSNLDLDIEELTDRVIDEVGDCDVDDSVFRERIERLQEEYTLALQRQTLDSADRVGSELFEQMAAIDNQAELEIRQELWEENDEKLKTVGVQVCRVNKDVPETDVAGRVFVVQAIDDIPGRVTIRRYKQRGQRASGFYSFLKSEVYIYGNTFADLKEARRILDGHISYRGWRG